MHPLTCCVWCWRTTGANLPHRTRRGASRSGARCFAPPSRVSTPFPCHTTQTYSASQALASRPAKHASAPLARGRHQARLIAGTAERVSKVTVPTCERGRSGLLQAYQAPTLHGRAYRTCSATNTRTPHTRAPRMSAPTIPATARALQRAHAYVVMTTSMRRSVVVVDDARVMPQARAWA